MPADSSERPERAARKARRRAEEAAANSRLDPAVLLGDIDAWNLRQEGDWLRFDARLAAGSRGYMRRIRGGDILADAPGPLTAILGIGGPREAGFTRGPARFRCHIVAPGDHIGAVGMEGTARAGATAVMQQIPHRSAEALLADEILGQRSAAFRGLPLIFVRCETQPAAGIEDLARGIAFENFTLALDSLGLAAKTLMRPARVLAVRLGYGLEDLGASPDALLWGWRDLMAGITLELRRRGLAPPVFLMRAESGTVQIADHAAIRAGWDLALAPGPHRLAISGPAYAFAQDRFGRLTDQGRADQARMEAHALQALAQGDAWASPQALLAEGHCDTGTGRIEVVFSALSDLVLDGADPFGAGRAAGFRLRSDGRDITIRGVAVSEQDPRRLILDCDPWQGAAELYLACDLQPTGDDRPVNRSRIRDQWQAVAAPETGGAGRLHRWALPAVLPVRPLLPPAKALP